MEVISYKQFILSYADDPKETKDLSALYPEMVNKLKGKINAARHAVVDQGTTVADSSNPANFNNFWSPGWC